MYIPLGDKAQAAFEHYKKYLKQGKKTKNTSCFEPCAFMSIKIVKEEEKLGGGGSSYTFNYNATAAAHKAGGGVSLGEGPLAQQGDVKAHHLLVLLLRLRQICNHPGLIQSMLDTETKQSEGIEDQDGEDMDLISAMEDININKEKSSVDKTENILDKANPVFATDSTSSKINMVVDELIKLKDKKKNEGKIY